jgi:hypothetical protein
MNGNNQSEMIKKIVSILMKGWSEREKEELHYLQMVFKK